MTINFIEQLIFRNVTINIWLVFIFLLGVTVTLLPLWRRVKRQQKTLTAQIKQQQSVIWLEHQVMSGISADAVIAGALEKIRDTLAIDCAAYYQYQPKDNSFRLAASQLTELLSLPNDVNCEQQSCLGYALIHNVDVLVAKLSADNRYHESNRLAELGLYTALVSPVESESVQQPLGCILLAHSYAHNFSESELEFIASMVNVLSLAAGQREKNRENDLLRQAMAETADAIVITDIDGNIEWINDAYSHLTGYSLDEAIGQNPRILNSDRQGKAFYQNMWQTILSGKRWQSELYNKRKNGDIYLEDESITPVTDGKGNISHFIGIKRDITEQRKLQRQIEQAQKMEVLSQLTGGIAHDFNNVLAVIIGYSDLGIEVADKAHERQQLVRYFKEVNQSARKAKDLITQLLSFTRPDELEVHELSFSNAVKESIRMLRPVLPAGIELDIHCQDDLWVKANPVQLHQVVMNLLLNARDSITEQGVIRVEIANLLVENLQCGSCHHKFSGQWLKFSVIDNGVGIKPEHIDKIFEPFFTTKEIGKGVGMGLAVTHGLVHKFGGHILLSSAPEQQTEFAVYLPLISQQPETEQGQTRIIKTVTATSKLPIARVMVVDDEISLGNFIKVLLEQHGYQVDVFIRSTDALNELLQHPDKYQLLLTDQYMPGLTGLELIRKVKTVKNRLPCLLYSGDIDYLQTQDVDMSRVKMVKKPLDNQELISSVALLLQTSNLQRADQ